MMLIQIIPNKSTFQLLHIHYIDQLHVDAILQQMAEMSPQNEQNVYTCPQLTAV